MLTDPKTRTPTVWGIGGEIAFPYWQLIGLALTIGITFLVGKLTMDNPSLDVRHVVALGIVASLLTTPYAWAYEHVLLFIPLLLLFPYFDRSWGKRLLWFGWVVVLPWFLFWIATQRGWDTFSVLMPLSVGVVYYWIMIRKKDVIVSKA
ncbi:MAG: hypothetical protein JXB38_08815 [Anaerolineales bacterium]|nr:hypothetical protein [Anaerolineales bacterium]